MNTMYSSRSMRRASWKRIFFHSSVARPTGMAFPFILTRLRNSFLLCKCQHEFIQVMTVRDVTKRKKFQPCSMPIAFRCCLRQMRMPVEDLLGFCLSTGFFQLPPAIHHVSTPTWFWMLAPAQLFMLFMFATNVKKRNNVLIGGVLNSKTWILTHPNNFRGHPIHCLFARCLISFARCPWHPLLFPLATFQIFLPKL